MKTNPASTAVIQIVPVMSYWFDSVFFYWDVVFALLPSGLACVSSAPLRLGLSAKESSFAVLLGFGVELLVRAARKVWDRQR